VTKLEEIRIKCELFANGINIGESAKEALQQRDSGRPVTFADFATTNGIILKFPDNLWINAPIAIHNPNLVKNTDWDIKYQNDKFIVENCSDSFEVDVIPTPKYPENFNSNGIQFKKYAHTHCDRLRVSPIFGCAFDCKFCDVNLIEECKYRKFNHSDIFEAIDAARIDEIQPAKHMLISGGTPAPLDREYLTELCEAVIIEYPDFEVDVMATPDGKSIDIRRLANVGLNGASLNIEIYNETVAKKLMPKKAAATIPARWKILEEAVKEMEDWSVRSLIIVGLEPLKSLVLGVENLCQRGVMPVLSPFRPHPKTVLRDLPAPSANEMMEAYIRCSEIAEKYGINLGPKCIPCQHNTIAVG
jgi:hypothetical protein